MKIREFENSDSQSVSEIIKENLLSVNSKDYSKETIKALIKDTSPYRLLEKASVRKYYVIEDSGEIVGIGGYQEDDVHTFYVKVGQHGQGIGRMLMEKVLESARADGLTKLRCASTHYAEKFYASFGFKRIEEKTTEFYDNTTITFIVMEKEL